MKSVVQLHDVSFSYGDRIILDRIDLAIKQSEFLGLVGPNAGGKTTLLKIILGLLVPDSGRVSVMDKSPQEGRSMIGYCPQYASFSREFPISVEDTVLLGRLGSTRAIGGYRRHDWIVAQEVMDAAEISDIKARSLASLSGGQLQRVLIARALACEPKILMLDEPTANIDLRVEEDIFDLLKELNKRMTIIVVSHDIGFISEYVTRVACLNQTLVCHETSALTGKIIEQLYGPHVRMIDHVHEAGSRGV
ncbi:MAG: ABC transporter ATP-binding protein [Gammaproteobacteria bacterium]|nr:ABC transporter ATP-binding protein [Gammaproteobacteria bacterium]MCI0591792.1 ABC transporter ATP-binding protein [Gammaproteobacteria bacterium]